MNVKHISISSYSDLQKISKDIHIIHFRKFINQKILQNVFEKNSNIKQIEISKSAFKKCNKKVLDMLSKYGISYKISIRNRGRPNMVEYKLQQMVLKTNSIKL